MRGSGLLVAESESDHDEVPGPPDSCSPLRPGALVLSYILAAVAAVAVVAPAPGPALPLPTAFGTPGKSSVTVRPPPGVSCRRAVPPLETASRCTMARPSPV